MRLDKEIHNLRQILNIIGTRGVGHTTLLKKGVSNYDRKFGVVGLTQEHAKEIVETENDLAVVASLKSMTRFEGMSIPVAIDNAVWYNIISDTISVMEKSLLKEDIKPIIDNIMQLAEIYQERSHFIESKILDYMICPFLFFSKREKIRKEIFQLIVDANNDRRLEYAFKNLGFTLKK